MRKVLVGLALLVPSITFAVMPSAKQKKNFRPVFFQLENWSLDSTPKWSSLPNGGPALAAQSSVGLFTNIKVSDDTLGRPQHEPHLAISGNQVYALFKDWRTGSLQQVFFARSTDCGSTWEPNYQIVEPTRILHSDPVIGVHPNGDIFACILGGSPGVGNDVFVARSTDHGASFGTARSVSGGFTGGFVDKEWMEIGPTGNIYVTWFIGFDSSQESEIRFVRSTDGGTSWSAPEKLNDNPPDSSFRHSPQVIEGPNGVVHVIWGFDDRDDTSGIYITTSTDSGQTFGPNRFIAHQFLNDNMPWRTGLLPSGAVDRENGNIYIAWYDSRLRSGYTDIAFVRSTDDGITWSPTTFVNSIGFRGDTTQQFMPAISVDPEGRVFLTWYDTRISRGNVVDVFYTYSENYGQTWAPEQRVTTVGSIPVLGGFSRSVMGDYNGLAADRRAAYAIWGDSRNGNQDIYFARIATPSAICAFAKGDMDGDGVYTVTDVVDMLNCAFIGVGCCDICYADVNCDGMPTPADVVLELNRVFLGMAFPCQ